LVALKEKKQNLIIKSSRNETKNKEKEKYTQTHVRNLLEKKQV
jgi:hypothetical protein